MININKLGEDLKSNLLKSRSGIYEDTSENRRMHRVGQHYGSASASEEKGSKKEQREARLKKYQETLSKVQEKLNDPNASAEAKKMGAELEAKWKEKISKLEARIDGKKSGEPSKKMNLKDAADKAVDKTEERAKKVSFKKGDIVSGRTAGGMKVSGRFVEISTHKGQEFVTVQPNPKDKHSFWSIPIDSAVNESAKEREEAKSREKADGIRDKIHNLQAKIDAIYNDPEVQEATNAETGDISEEFQREVDKHQKEINKLEKEYQTITGHEL